MGKCYLKNILSTLFILLSILGIWKLDLTVLYPPLSLKADYIENNNLNYFNKIPKLLKFCLHTPCVPMCILSTLSALNSIENDYYHIEFRMDSMHIGTQAHIY